MDEDYERVPEEETPAAGDTQKAFNSEGRELKQGVEFQTHQMKSDNIDSQVGKQTL